MAHITVCKESWVQTALMLGHFINRLATIAYYMAKGSKNTMFFNSKFLIQFFWKFLYANRPCKTFTLYYQTHFCFWKNTTVTIFKRFCEKDTTLFRPVYTCLQHLFHPLYTGYRLSIKSFQKDIWVVGDG